MPDVYVWRACCGCACVWMRRVWAGDGDRDHRNESLQSWFINDFVLGPTGLGNPNVSGFYFDDGWANTSQVRGSG